MAEYIGRIIGYVFLAAVTGTVYFFLHSQFFFTALVLMAAAPVISFLCVFLLRRMIAVRVSGTQESYGRQGETAYFRVRISNPTIFVSLDTKVVIQTENVFLQTSGQRVFSVPVHALRGYELTLPVVADAPGLVRICVKSVWIKDLMGFFRLKKKTEVSAELPVLPQAVSDIEYEKTALEQGMLESEESTKRGNDFSDVQEVREYIPGDRLMSIHWKLSAKRDILMVKNRVTMSDHQLVILPELCIANTEILSRILTITYSVIAELIAAQTTVRLLYWNAARYTYEDVRIDYREELDAAFVRMYYETGYKNPNEAAEHMALVHPEMHAYLHVCPDGQEVRMTVRENG